MINKIFLYLFVCALSVFLFTSCDSKPEENTQPNIIFILADDLGAGDLQITGHPYAKTPALDKLAEEGIQYQNFSVASSWCSPSRYAFMTGQYPSKRFDGDRNLLPSELTVTKMLNDNGYTTAHFGKWHMNRNTKQSQSPSDFGIDVHATYRSHDPVWDDEDMEKPNWRASLTDTLVDRTISFIQKNKEKPFYINLWVFPTHSYIDPTPEQLAVYRDLKVSLDDFKNPLQRKFLEFVGKYGDIDKAMQAYCADITAMDKALARLFQYLDENNLSENTLIAFSSDNGPGPLTGQIKTGSVVNRYEKIPTLLNSVGSAAEFRERKLSLHEGGIRVPFFIKWPKGAQTKAIDKESIINGVDWLPTVAAICGIELTNLNIDGEDFSASLNGKTMVREDPLFWKVGNESAIRKGKYKGFMKNDTFSLYNLEKDISESRDLSEEEPVRSAESKKELVEWVEGLGGK